MPKFWSQDKKENDFVNIFEALFLNHSDVVGNLHSMFRTFSGEMTDHSIAVDFKDMSYLSLCQSGMLDLVQVNFRQCMAVLARD